MKILELDLKKKVLIVDAENGRKAFDIIFENFSIEESGKYEFICKGSELTEEIAKEFVHIDNHTFNTDYYTDYRNENKDCRTPLQSFISAVESKGFYWLENPIKHPKDYEVFPDSLSLYAEQEKLHFEAEAKTFRNPLIFVKNYENKIKCYCGHTTYCDCEPLEESKQETLEEVALKFTAGKSFIEIQSRMDFITGAKFGAKWQQERMYSEEEVYNLLTSALWDLSEKGYNQIEFDKWFKQFKKK